MHPWRACLQCLVLWLMAFCGHAASPAAPDAPVEPPQPRLQIQLGHGFGVRALAWSPDSRTLATGGSDHNVQLWHAESGRLIRRISGHDDDVHRLAFSPDGQQLASLDDSGVAKIWDVATGRPLATRADAAQPTQQLSVLSDGSLLMVGKAGLQRWTPSTDAVVPIGVAQNLGEVSRLAHTADGGVVAIAATAVLGDLGSPLALWDRASNRFVALGTRQPDREGLQGMALSRDGLWLAVSWSDHDRTRLELWDVKARRLVSFRQFGQDERVDWLEFDAAGRLLGNKGVRIRHPTAVNETVFVFKVPGLAASPLVSYEPAARVYPVDLASLNPENAHLAVVTMGQIQIVNLRTGAATNIKSTAIPVKGLVFRDPERIRMVFGRGYATWGLDSREVNRDRLDPEILAVSPDGTLAVGAEAGAVSTTFGWWISTRASACPSSGSAYGMGVSAVFSRDGGLVAVGTEYPSTRYTTHPNEIMVYDNPVPDQGRLDPVIGAQAAVQWRQPIPALPKGSQGSQAQRPMCAGTFAQRCLRNPAPRATGGPSRCRRTASAWR